MSIKTSIILSLTQFQGGEESLRWQRIRLRDRLLLINKAFNRASLKFGASSAFASDPGGVPDVPGFYWSLPSWKAAKENRLVLGVNTVVWGV